MQYNKSFYEKHGIKVTDDPINYNKTAEQTQLENSLRQVTMGNSVTLHTVKLIEQAIDKYPDSEALKNYLYAAYIKTGQPDKGLACLNNTLQQHPDYAFGVINLANYYLQKGELDKAAEFLTKPYDVYRIEKEEYIHDSVFISYYQAVVRLALAKNDMKTAEKYHRLMFDYDPTNTIVKQIAGEIFRGRLRNMQNRLIAPSVREVNATQKAISGWGKSKKPPVFIHPEIQQLFEIGVEDMSEKVIQQILDLPRETLIQDLENVLADTIRRRDMYLEMEEWEEYEMVFPIHALYFLTELKAYDSLPKILNLLRQDQKFLDHWFHYALYDYFLPVLYILGNHQVTLLKAFVLEPNNYYFPRNIVLEAVTQIALRQPERREEIGAVFKEIAQTHLEQPNNKGLIDNSFLGGMLNDILNFKGTELEQEIISLFQKGWIHDGECGNLEEVLTELHKPVDTSFNRIIDLPATIYEMYSGNYTDEVKPQTTTSTSMAKDEDPYNLFIRQYMFGNLPYESNKKSSKDDFEDVHERPQPQETIRRVEPKVGRNDPCPCGSGKKYKKCHGA